MQVVLRPNGIDVFDNVGVVELLKEEYLRFDGSQVLGLHVCQLEALDSYEVACVCYPCVTVCVGVRV